MTWKHIAALAAGAVGGYWLGSHRRPEPGRQLVTVADLNVETDPRDPKLLYVIHEGDLVGELYRQGDGYSVNYVTGGGLDDVVATRKGVGFIEGLRFVADQLNRQE